MTATIILKAIRDEVEVHEREARLYAYEDTQRERLHGFGTDLLRDLADRIEELLAAEQRENDDIDGVSEI